MSIEDALLSAVNSVSRAGGCPDYIIAPEKTIRQLMLALGFSYAQIDLFIESIPNED
jgi:hypothetical protein